MIDAKTALDNIRHTAKTLPNSSYHNMRQRSTLYEAAQALEIEIDELRKRVGSQASALTEAARHQYILDSYALHRPGYGEMGG